MTQSEIEFRSAELVDVSYPKRQIDLIVMPYETETMIHEPGRSYTEIVSRGAFDGVETRTSQIKVNVDHRVSVEGTIGKTVALHPSRQEGLVAELKIFRGPAGDHALEVASESSLGASAGFSLLRDQTTGRVWPDAETWEGRDRRRLNRLRLHHIALTPDPAYETAQVLAVRQVGNGGLTGVVLTPNFDQLRLEELERLAAEIDSRYPRL